MFCNTPNKRILLTEKLKIFFFLLRLSSSTYSAREKSGILSFSWVIFRHFKIVYHFNVKLIDCCCWLCVCVPTPLPSDSKWTIGKSNGGWLLLNEEFIDFGFGALLEWTKRESYDHGVDVIGKPSHSSVFLFVFHIQNWRKLFKFPVHNKCTNKIFE